MKQLAETILRQIEEVSEATRKLSLLKSRLLLHKGNFCKVANDMYTAGQIQNLTFAIIEAQTNSIFLFEVDEEWFSCSDPLKIKSVEMTIKI